jgi:hypothetical protein
MHGVERYIDAIGLGSTVEVSGGRCQEIPVVKPPGCPVLAAGCTEAQDAEFSNLAW